MVGTYLGTYLNSYFVGNDQIGMKCAGTGKGGFSDISQLTMFPDYR